MPDDPTDTDAALAALLALATSVRDDPAAGESAAQLAVAVLELDAALFDGQAEAPSRWRPRPVWTIRLVRALGDWYVVHCYDDEDGDGSDVGVEGSAADMRGLAAAIEARCHFTARRCQATPVAFVSGSVADRVGLRSPAAESAWTWLTFAEADVLARNIRRMVGADREARP